MTTFIVDDSEENVMGNLRSFVQDFRLSMLEVMRDKPSVGGKIGNMDFQQMSAYQVFFYIHQMQDSIKDFPNYSEDSKEQIKLWAAQMESEARRVFKDRYDDWYRASNH